MALPYVVVGWPKVCDYICIFGGYTPLNVTVIYATSALFHKFALLLQLKKVNVFSGR